MAGNTSTRSESEASNKTKSKSNKNNAAEDVVEISDDEEGQDEEDGSEYEIEAVLDAKRGHFPDGHMGYFVKWKGYDHSENSWVDEEDAVNAIELVDEYWRQNPKKKAALQLKKSPKKATRKSMGGGDETSEADISTTKKRSRKSTSKKVDEDEMEVDEDDHPPKKAKKNATQVSKAKARAVDTPEGDEIVVGNMDDYLHMKSWEALIKTVDTIERKQDGTLQVFFTLTTGEAATEGLETCKPRFPQKLLDFYEKNLRWRTVEDS